MRRSIALLALTILILAPAAHADKTVFQDGNKALGVQGTKVTAAFLNATNNHRHDGTAADGSGVLDYYVDSGTANAVVITPSPAIAAHVVGMPLWFKAAATNTGAATIAVGGLPAVAITKQGGTALAAGDIAAGQICQVAWDGTRYQLVTNGVSKATADTLYAALGDFTRSLATNGYQKLPGGLIIQWGEEAAAHDIVGGTTATLTFPVVFPTACLTVLTGVKGTNTAASTVSARNVTTFGFEFVFDEWSGINQSLKGIYIAIGY